MPKVRALVLADRSEMSRRDRDVLVLTGTAHLLAISGLHIGLAAGGGMLATRILAWFLPLTFAGGRLYLLTAGGGLLAASAYAALAGFGVPTVRALLMVAAVLAALATDRRVHPVRPWLLAMMTVLLANPFAPLTAGFWLSFTAVAALLLLFAPRPGRRPWWQSLPMAQAAVMLLLLPLSAVWFQGFSPAGFLANLVAIPWVSFLVVPFVLAGAAALAVSGELAGLLWAVASGAIALLWTFLEFMAGLQGRLTSLTAPSLATTVLAVLGASTLLLPRGLPIRWTGAFLMAPLLVGGAPWTDPQDIEVEVLDAGQGTAVLVTTGGRKLLYDSGPGDGAEGNLVASVVAPALNRLGNSAPDRVVISHGDLDHKNVLWDASGNALLIDWESARHINPTYETLLEALDWSGITAHFHTRPYERFLERYISADGILCADSIPAAFSAILGAWVNWMMYNVGRAAGLEGLRQRALGSEQVDLALATLLRLEKQVPRLRELALGYAR